MAQASSFGTVRTVRRVLVLVSAVVVIVIAACAPAWASDRGETAAPADTTALARAAIVESRFADALRILGRLGGPSHSEEERVAAAELRVVVERWVALRQVVFPRAIGTARGEREASSPRTSAAVEAATFSTWEDGFTVARTQLIAGDFDLAAQNLEALQSATPTAAATLRARALDALASELVAKQLVLGWTEQRAAAAPDWHRDPRNRSTRRWYGWQTLTADGVSLTVVPVLGAAIGKQDDGGRIALATAASYVLVPGIIHLVHGRPGAAAGSVGLRVALPIGGALLGYAAGSGGHDGEDAAGLALVGFVLGGMGASALDAAVLSRETIHEQAKEGDASRSEESTRSTPEPREPRSARAASTKPITFVPTGGPRKEGGFDLGVGAIF
jgi:hypothetical protein